MLEIFLQLSVFLLTFLIFYGLLRKTKLFSPLINTIIAVIVAFYVLSVFSIFKNDLMIITSSLLILFLAFFGVLLISKGFKKTNLKQKNK